MRTATGINAVNVKFIKFVNRNQKSSGQAGTSKFSHT